MDNLWMLVAYVSGSAFTWWAMTSKVDTKAIEATIDNLIAQGYLRTRRTAAGETEILKWNEKD